jgi:hypothetical protein
LPFDERGDRICDVFEHVRAQHIIERVVVEGQLAGVPVKIGAARTGAEGLEAIDVDGRGIEAGNGRRPGANFHADFPRTDPARDFFVMGHAGLRPTAKR